MIRSLPSCTWQCPCLRSFTALLPPLCSRSVLGSTKCNFASKPIAKYNLATRGKPWDTGPLPEVSPEGAAQVAAVKGIVSRLQRSISRGDVGTRGSASLHPGLRCAAPLALRRWGVGNASWIKAIKGNLAWPRLLPLSSPLRCPRCPTAALPRPRRRRRALVCLRDRRAGGNRSGWARGSGSATTRRRADSRR